MSTRTASCLAGLAAALTMSACGGAPSVAMQGTADDESAVRGLADRYVAAFNASDAAGLAALVADDYQAVAPDGMMVNGPAGVAKMEGEAMQMRRKMGLDVTLAAATGFLRWIDAEHATMGGSWTVAGVPAGQPNRGSWLAVARKSPEGQWLMTSSLAADFVQPAPAEAQPTPAN